MNKIIDYIELKKLICYIPQQLDVCKQIALLRKILKIVEEEGESALKPFHLEYFHLYKSMKSFNNFKTIKFTKFGEDTILVDGKHRSAVSIELKLQKIEIEFIDPEQAIFSKDISSDIIKNIHKEVFN